MNWDSEFKANLLSILYRPDQPRDEKGRWTSGGSGGAAGDGNGGDSGVGGRKTPNTELETILHDSLTKFDDFTKQNFKGREQDFAYHGSYDMVLKEGRWYDAQGATDLPDGVSKGPDKGCFENAAKLAISNDDYTYVEGYAMADFMPGFAIHHAWVVDNVGRVIDNTWKTDGAAYVGIPFTKDHLLNTLLTTETYGMIPEFPIKGYNPMRDGFPDNAIIRTNEDTFANQGEGEEKGMDWLDKFKKNLLEVLYRADQPRDEKGRWTTGGAASTMDDGRIDISGYPGDANDITKEMFMAQAEYGDIKAQMASNLEGIRSDKHQHLKQNVTGDLDHAKANQIVQNMKHELSDYGAYLAGDTMSRGRDYIDSFESSLLKGLDDGSLVGISAEDLNALGQDNIEKLMYQEIESNRQAFTDHGIRHITGNVLRQKQIMREMDPNITGKDELMGDFIMVNHDVGYTTPLIREGGLRGIMSTKHHPEFSEKIAMQQKEMWDVDKIFSSGEYDRMTDIIRTHDGTALDSNDWLTTSVRVSDNLSLFNGEKLPSMFKYVPGGDEFLVEMGKAAKANDTIAFEAQRDLLYNQIDKANVSPQLKRDLKAATSEINYMTPKFTMGVLAGDISSIGRTTDGLLSVKVAYNQYDSFLQQYFDMGQNQTRKFLKDYGVTEYNQTKYVIGGILELEVLGVP